ncbi:MAG: putative membrane protein YfcA [Kiritimatiellia bacterium]|jgi:uncharacterized membrane protein YfcA
MDITQPLLALPPYALLLIGFSLYLAYCIFGIVGFGAILISGPVMAHFVPLTTIVPLLALIDFSASITNLTRDRAQIAWPELVPLLGFMVAGSLLGAFLLFSLKANIMLLLFGLLAILYPVYSIIKTAKKQASKVFSRGWSVVFGSVGGIFSAMFGSGGFIYSIYIISRVENKVAIRATQSTLIGFSTLTRIAIFTFAGIYSGADFFLLLLATFPIMLIGIYSGRKIAHQLNRAQFMTIVQCLVMVSGLSLVIRYISL